MRAVLKPEPPMRTPLRFAVALVLALPFIGCTDDRRPLTAPVQRSDYVMPGIPSLPGNPTLPTIKLPDPNDFVEIVAGSDFTCARKNNGNVYCWGLNNEGQAGTAAKGYCYDPAPCVDKPTLVSNASFSTAIQISAGARHLCALTSAGAAFCWGSSANGQIGAGFFGPTFGPIAVNGLAGGAPLTFSSIGAGGFSSCGTTSGGLFCWGAEFATPGVSSNAVYPSQVFSTNGFTKVSVGYLSACAIWTVSGTSYSEPYCWGVDNYGQVGQDPALGPIAALFANNFAGKAVSRVAMQSETTCFDQQSGIVQCVGRNDWGQLGNAAHGSGASTFQLQTVGGGLALHGVTTGSLHTCALAASGAAYCWGYGFDGQLGNGVSAMADTAQPVLGGHTYRAIAAGSKHTCAIGTDNHIYCWGDNYHGQLGSYTGSKFSPVQATDPL